MTWTSRDFRFHDNGTIEELLVDHFTDDTIRSWRKSFTNPKGTWYIIFDSPKIIVMMVIVDEGDTQVRFSFNTKT